jgi:hypothetical protein
LLEESLVTFHFSHFLFALSVHKELKDDLGPTILILSPLLIFKLVLRASECTSWGGAC